MPSARQCVNQTLARVVSIRMDFRRRGNVLIRYDDGRFEIRRYNRPLFWLRIRNRDFAPRQVIEEPQPDEENDDRSFRKE